jgi:uncharacterized protein YjfI (DUF2170 family)
LVTVNDLALVAINFKFHVIAQTMYLLIEKLDVTSDAPKFCHASTRDYGDLPIQILIFSPHLIIWANVSNVALVTVNLISRF